MAVILAVVCDGGDMVRRYPFPNFFSVAMVACAMESAPTLA
jgi:hypothetical protein